jgi:predicted HTH transcriptional regulator
MRRQHLRELIAGGESLTVEFKRKFTSDEKISKELIAFANTQGGYLLIGVDDDKKIVGVQSEKSEIDYIDNVCEYCIDPPLDVEIEIVNIEYKDVIVVRVAESDTKPHKLLLAPDGTVAKPHERHAYIRQGSAALQASKEVTKALEAQNLDAKPVTLSIGKHERRFFDYLEAHGRATARQLADDANLSERRTARLLVRLVQIGALRIFTHEKADFYTLIE